MDQGHATAQNNLGEIYYNGKGVPQDFVLAHMWLSLSSSRGDKCATANRNTIEEEMSKQQIEKAQEMARDWETKKQLN